MQSTKANASQAVGDVGERRDRWLSRLVEEEGESAYRTAYRLLGNREDAHDAVQESLAQALRRWQELRNEDAMQGWFFRILVNHCISRHRRRSVRERALRLLGKKPTQTTPDPSIGNDISVRILPRLLQLPLKQRTALILRFGDERSVREIADAMDVSSETVKTHLKRGLAELRKNFAASGKEPRT